MVVVWQPSSSSFFSSPKTTRRARRLTVRVAPWHFGVEVVTELEEAEFSQVALFFFFYYFLLLFLLLLQVSELNMTPMRKVEENLSINNNTPNIWLLPYSLHTYSINRFIEFVSKSFRAAATQSQSSLSLISCLSFSLYI